MNVDALQELGARLPVIARDAILASAEGRTYVPPSPDPPALPCFVTLRNPDGSLRGCIGRLTAARATLFAEVARNAVLAASGDPRFEPVEDSEVPGLLIEVSVLSPAEPVRDLSDLNPALYGVIVSDGRGRQGVLLPGIPGIDEPAAQVAIAAKKAGIVHELGDVNVSDLEIQRFVTNKFRDAA